MCKHKKFFKNFGYICDLDNSTGLVIANCELNPMSPYYVKEKNCPKYEKNTKKQEKIYLICSQDGTVIDVLKAKNFKEAYDQTLAQNYGEILVELSSKDLEKIKKEAK